MESFYPWFVFVHVLGAGEGLGVTLVGHLSASPITPSSDPTTTIRSAM